VGDTLLLMATESAIGQLYKSPDLVLLGTAPCPVQDRSTKAPQVIGILTVVIILSALDWVPIAAGAVMGAFLLVATRCLRTQDLYRCIEWRILVIVYGMLALGLAMEKSGLSTLMACQLAHLGHSLPVPLAAKPYVLLALVYLCTNLLTEVLTNNATVLIMAPIAIDLAQLSGLSARPFALAACIASSASFSTPIGYQTNTYVYSIGNYRFKDFVKVGLPLNLLFFVGCMVLIPWLCPLS
jgi:di/tricarboxylate transporter